jgi:hypothetical protein
MSRNLQVSLCLGREPSPDSKPVRWDPSCCATVDCNLTALRVLWRRTENSKWEGCLLMSDLFFRSPLRNYLLTNFEINRLSPPCKGFPCLSYCIGHSCRCLIHCKWYWDCKYAIIWSVRQSQSRHTSGSDVRRKGTLHLGMSASWAVQKPTLFRHHYLNFHISYK